MYYLLSERNLKDYTCCLERVVAFLRKRLRVVWALAARQFKTDDLQRIVQCEDRWYVDIWLSGGLRMTGEIFAK